jgi:hypothetical protein
MLPHARRKGLVVRDLPDETLVYDLETHRAHCLNRTAARIWQGCDGQTPVAELAARLHPGLPLATGEAVVREGLRQLAQARLLRTPTERRDPGQPPPAPLTRRELARRVATAGGAALLPVVASIVAPTPAQAVTCIGDGSPCTDSARCCSQLCVGNLCIPT